MSKRKNGQKSKFDESDLVDHAIDVGILVDMNLPVNAARSKFIKTNIFWFFLTTSFAVAIADPIVTSFGPQTLIIQIIFLTISTVLMVVGVVSTASHCDRFMPFYDKVIMMVDGQAMLEIVPLLLGWMLIFYDTGGAAIRCLRVLRFVFYFELTSIDYPVGYIPAEHPMSFHKSCIVMVQYLNRVGAELFTEQTRGGSVVFLMWFFLTYVVALICWYNENNLIDTWGGPTHCNTLTHCFITIFKLAVMDCGGMDYVSLTANAGYPGYTILLFLYWISCGIILYNGLIAIFSECFLREHESEEEVEEETEEYNKSNAKVEPIIEDADSASNGGNGPVTVHDVAYLLKTCGAMHSTIFDAKSSFDVSMLELRKDLNAMTNRR